MRARLRFSLSRRGISSAGRALENPANDASVDINTASLAKSAAGSKYVGGSITRYRPCRAKNELIDRGAVTSQVYDRIKDRIIAHHEKQ